ncbi:hypothetical protein Hanom_Chr02g00174381 [Helianthus anomalus]
MKFASFSQEHHFYDFIPLPGLLNLRFTHPLPGLRLCLFDPFNLLMVELN